MKVVLALTLASLALTACGSSPGVCHAGCLCIRKPEDCAGSCVHSYTQSVDGSAPQFFCSNGPPYDAGSQESSSAEDSPGSN